MSVIGAVDRAKVDRAERIVAWITLIVIDSVPGWPKLGCVMQEMEGVAPLLRIHSAGMVAVNVPSRLSTMFVAFSQALHVFAQWQL